MKVLGIILIVLSIIFFMHGSAKMAATQKDNSNSTITLDTDIILVEKSEEEKFANYSLNISAGLFITGVVFLFIASSRGKRGKIA